MDSPPGNFETREELLHSGLTPALDFVQVDISIIIPLGELSTLNVATSSDGVNPSGKVEIIPQLKVIGSKSILHLVKEYKGFRKFFEKYIFLPWN